MVGFFKALRYGAACLLCAVFLVGCQVATPSSRIAENPVLYQSLSPEHRLLVQQGRICNGMNKSAVFLAWGYPAGSPVTGEKESKRFERWVYVRNRAVPVDTFGGWHHGCWHHPGLYDDFGMGSGVVYVPEEVASVTFENEKVTEWESRR